MMDILWTFAGKLNKKDMCEGTSASRWNKTENGWADDESFRIWAGMVVAHKKKQGLDKMLIFVDNAAIHFNDEVAALFAANNIMLMGLIPSSTGWTQPLDRCYFHPVKPILERLWKESGEILTELNVAKFFEMACKEYEVNQHKSGKAALAAGFKLAGIVPFNPSATLAGTHAADLRLAPTAEQKERAKKVGEEAGKILVATVQEQVTAAFMGRLPEAALALEPLGEAAKAIRKAKYGAEKEDKEELYDIPGMAEGFVSRQCPTSTQFAARRAKEEAAKAKEEQEKAARKDAKEESKARKEREEAEKEIARADKKVQQAAKKALEEAAKAARQAAKAAKHAGGAKGVGQGGVGGKKAKVAVKRKRDEAENPYRKAYKKKK
jgi:hypothetical protein